MTAHMGAEERAIPACRVCGNTEGNKVHVAREMMLGLRDEFEYIECAGCGCVQIKVVPEDLSRYYPEDYYSFRARRRRGFLRENPVRRFFKRKRTENYLGTKSLIGTLMEKFSAAPDFLDELKRAKLRVDSELLDVGCGSAARYLLMLHREGFSALEGADPFIERDVVFDNGIKVFKKFLCDVSKRYDMVILNSSFEHMPDPAGVLKDVSRVLKPGRYAILRIPLASSYAWRKYGVNWVALDAPRHLYLHTVDSIKLLAGQSGLEVADVIYTSTDFQFWGSEQYLQDMPLEDDRSYMKDKSPAYFRDKKGIFTEQDIESFKVKARELNREGEGDVASFFLYKPANEKASHS